MDQEIQNWIKTNECEEDENTQIQSTTWIRGIREQLRWIKIDINNIIKENNDLKKNNRLNKIKEYTIENEVFNNHYEHIQKLKNNSIDWKSTNHMHNMNYKELENNMKKQYTLMEALRKSIQESEEEESKWNENIKWLEKQFEISNTNIIRNNNDIIILRQQNEMLNKDWIVQLKPSKTALDERKKNNKSSNNSNNNNSNIVNNSYSYPEVYKRKINELNKQIFHYKKSSEVTGKTVAELQKINTQLKEVHKLRHRESNQTVSVLPEKNGNAIPNNQSQRMIAEEDKIKKLKETLDSSKEIEEQLIKQIINYKERLKEWTSSDHIPNNGQIEFGIDRENPFYIDDENNNPLKTNKMTSTQFNQFTYIWFKNFEARKISLEIAKKKLLNELVNSDGNSAKDGHNSQAVNSLTKKILSIWDSDNACNAQKLSIFINALYFNSNYSNDKLEEYLAVLFSYTKEYSPEKEEQLKQELINERQGEMQKLLSFMNRSCKYISWLEVKNIIDHNNIDLEEHWIEFIFYLMKQFTDKSSKFEDLLIQKIEELFHNNTTSANESMTEITNEEYIKTIKEAVSLITKGWLRHKITLRELIAIDIKRTDSTEVINIENWNERWQTINVKLSDIQLSCICSKFSIEKEIREINIAELEKELKSILNKALEQGFDQYNDDEDNEEPAKHGAGRSNTSNISIIRNQTN